MVRAYLESWEWNCCGEPFRVGDDVEFTVTDATASLRAYLGGEIGAGVDFAESHHEDDSARRIVRGVVTGLHGVALEHTEHRERQEPTPPLARFDLGNGAWAVTGSPSGETVVREPVVGTARLVPVARVPAALRFGEAGLTPAPPAENVSGYLVDLDPE